MRVNELHDTASVPALALAALAGDGRHVVAAAGGTLAPVLVDQAGGAPFARVPGASKGNRRDVPQHAVGEVQAVLLQRCTASSHARHAVANAGFVHALARAAHLAGTLAGSQLDSRSVALLLHAAVAAEQEEAAVTIMRHALGAATLQVERLHTTLQSPLAAALAPLRNLPPGVQTALDAHRHLPALHEAALEPERCAQLVDELVAAHPGPWSQPAIVGLAAQLARCGQQPGAKHGAVSGDTTGDGARRGNSHTFL